MKFLAVFAVFFMFGVSSQADEIKTDDGVLVLNKDNFEKATTDNEYIMIEFYTPRCEHCKALAPIYGEAAQILTGKKSAVKLANIDASQEQELAEKYAVSEYPTLKFFKNGSPSEDYTGDLEADDIVAWLLEKSDPSLDGRLSMKPKTFIDN